MSWEVQEGRAQFFSPNTFVTSGQLRRGQNLTALKNLSTQQLQLVTSRLLESQLDYINVSVLNLEKENHHQVGAQSTFLVHSAPWKLLKTSTQNKKFGLTYFPVLLDNGFNH